jgi:hypothetical protein
MNRPEEQLQRQVAAFLDVALPEDAVWWHTPNQRGTRSLAENKILKGLGVRKGIPDVLIYWQRQLYCIELKAPGKYFSTAQKAMRPRLVEAGARYVSEKRSLDEVITALRAYGIPLRARAA